MYYNRAVRKKGVMGLSNYSYDDNNIKLGNKKKKKVIQVSVDIVQIIMNIHIAKIYAT